MILVLHLLFTVIIYYIEHKSIIPPRAVASKLRRGVTLVRKWTMIKICVCDACSVFKFHCKSLMNCHYTPLTSTQTISHYVPI